MDGTPPLPAMLADKLSLQIESRKAPVDIYP
jgi:hypothetical protein